MSEILLINPSPKKTGKKKVNKMADKKKKKKSSGGTTKTIIKWKTKKNPIKKRAKRAASAVGQSVLGVNIGGAAKNTIALVGGMLAAKFAAKRFADGGGEGEDWTWKNYGFGILGGFVAAVGTQMIFKTPRATGQKVMEGALALMLYKAFVNEVVPKNDTLVEWFSGDDEVHPDYMGATDEGDPGDVWQGDQADFVMGADRYWRDIDDNQRMLPANQSTMGDALIQPTADMGDALVQPTADMGDDDYSRAYNRQF